MKNMIRDIIKFIVLGITTVSMFNYIESSFLIIYLKNNLLTIQLAALAVNISIISLIISKVQEIKKNNKDFDNVSILKSLKDSLTEQFFIIIIGLFVLSFYEAKIFNSFIYYDKFKLFLDVIIIAIFYNTLQVIIDTGNGLFIIVNDENNTLTK